jgi:hypothetical protein
MRKGSKYTSPNAFFERYTENFYKCSNGQEAYKLTEQELGRRFSSYASFRAAKCQHAARMRKMRLAQRSRPRRSYLI